MSEDLLRRCGTTASGQFAVHLTPEDAGWAFSGLRVLELPAGGRQQLDTGDEEFLVLPLAGACTVEVDGRTYRLRGRRDVFTAVTDHLTLPIGTSATITSADGGRFALPSARTDTQLPVTYHPASAVGVELRGAGSCSRQVNAYQMGYQSRGEGDGEGEGEGNGGVDRVLVCEVLTPGGNWSSYPPHKHDEHSDVERELEEIYYFEVRPGPGGPGFAFHRTYGTAPRPVELTAEARTGDVVLTPHGYHGPSMAAPGYDLYYLNVMAGPAPDRRWMVTDDPHHHWVRDTWPGQPVDPRLPMTVPADDAPAVAPQADDAPPADDDGTTDAAAAHREEHP